MDKLIQNFSIKSVADFFKNKISSFSPNRENLDYILKDKDFTHFSDLQKIGEVEFNNSDELIVFTCKFQGILSELSSKKKQFEIAKKVLKEDFKDGAIFIFYDDKDFFRFSFIRKNYGNKDQKFTNWKRYTYFVDPTKTNKTFRNRINGCNFSSLDDIQEAFNVEKLTKQFYNELFNWYQWSLSESDGFEVTFPNDISTDKDDRQIEEHLIRLITRLMFIWFIKKKKLIPDDIFNTAVLDKILVDFDPNSKTNGDYYNAILQNLFFASLNKPIDERIFATGKNYQGKDEHYGIKTLFRDNNDKSWFKENQTEIISLFKNVPFLNGGLFECLDKENDNGKIFYYDGFSRVTGRQKRAFLPNCIFFDEQKGIIPLLERYNFTIEENSTDDIEVALDPELLGKVFENLLGAYNPETKETARKQSGSFYTPREIVDYMVNESVIQYLKKECLTVPEATWNKLFNTDEIPETLTDNDCKKITTSLRNIKILDPACGSGAFPMGVLNTLIKVLKKVDTKNTLSNYDIKLELIENCIYGVDIQSIAVQISKLRFFISLVCEQETTTNVATNYGIKSLPNLETKFVAANTLIGLKQEAKSMIEWQDETLFELKNQLWDIRCHQNFRAQKWQEKKLLRQKDKELCEKIETYLKTIATKPNLALIDDYNKQVASQELEIKNLPVIWADVTETAMQTTMFENVTNQTQSLFKTDINKEKREVLKKSNKLLLKKIEQEKSKQHLADTSEALALIEWNPYDQNTSSSFFDPEWMFGTPNFDIVIGNPPYIQLQKLSNSEMYAKLNFETYSKSTDLYCLFYEMGIRLLKDKGNLCYITSNSWMRTKYGQALRKYFAEKSNPTQLINFEDVQIFQSAVVESNIMITEKSVFDGKLKAANVGNDLDNNSGLSLYLANKNIILKELDENGWILGNMETLNLKKKIENKSTVIKQLDLKINYGIRSGLNEVFIIDDKKKKDLVKEDKRNIEIIKPILRGRDLIKYSYNYANLWVVLAKYKDNINLKNNYPTIYRYLEDFEVKLKNRGQVKAGSHHWIELDNSPTDEYISNFDKPKIIWIVLSDKGKFAYDDTGSLTTDSCFIMSGENLKYLLSILNSKIGEWYFAQISTTSGMGTNMWKKYKIEQFPIKETTLVEMQKLEKIVDQILSNKKENGDTTVQIPVILTTQFQFKVST
ncbi:restriction endonuclease [Flavobacterium sp. RSP46]|uniref:Eco57I restriction-modification methylase domain-containing protein n=1 Tax=Flavobacterium sp. RSP46 TaxID=2497486 RepID=UPI000F85BACB|nr:N-6 DNA methylase [Flavobacterium sp. RSP46]RTY89447.1 restriction endonuclease [Flavobacterium sp. RSP46]